MRRNRAPGGQISKTVAALVLLGLGLTTSPALAQGVAIAGSVRSVAGAVEWRSRGARKWQTVSRGGLALGPGDELRTGKTGSCCLVVGGTLVTVGPNSHVRMPSSQARRGIWRALQVLVGRLIVRVFGDRQMEVVTPAASVGASGTAFAVEVDTDGVTVVTVAEGKVDVRNDYGQVALSTGQSTRVVPGEPPPPPIAMNLDQTLLWQGALPELSLEPHLRLVPKVKPGELDQQAESAGREAQAHPEDVAAQLRAAALLYDAGKADQAEAAARRALALRPEAQAQALLALSLLAQGRPADAAQALEGGPGGPWHDLAAGVLNLARGGGAIAEAIRLLSAASGELPQARVPLAVAAMRAGRGEVAAQAVRAALEARPDDADALALEAMLELADGDLEAASEQAQRAVAAGPQRELAQEAAALVAFFSDDWQAAAAHAAKALEIAPRSGAALAIAADVAAARDDLDAAMEYALRAVAVDPGSATAWRVLGLLYASEGVYSKAASCLERAIELRPKMVSAYSTLAVVYSRQGRLAQALKQLQTGLSLGSAEAQLENDLGALLVNLGRLEEGIEHLNRAAKLAEKGGKPWAMPYGNLALAYLDLNEFAQAEAMVRKALALGADSAAIHTLAARVLMEQDRYDRALAELRRALDIDPDYALARVKLAELYHRLGQDRQAAKETLRAGLTDAGAMVEERFYSRTELRGQVGSHLARVKTDGRGAEGKVSYFGSYADEELPRWRERGKFQHTSAQLMAGGRAEDGAKSFMRLTYDRVDQDRPGPVTDPDADYTSRGDHVTVEIGRRERVSHNTEVSALARYRRTAYRADNPDSMTIDPGTGALVDPKPYRWREAEETRWGAELSLRRQLGRACTVTVGAAGEWGRDSWHGELWEVRPGRPGLVSGFYPYARRDPAHGWTAYAEVFKRQGRDSFRVGGYVARARGTATLARPRLEWRRELGAGDLLWVSTYPVFRDDVSWLSPTDPWRQDHRIKGLNFAAGGVGQFYEVRYERPGSAGDLLDVVAFYRDFDDLLVFVGNPQWSPEGGYSVVGDGEAYGAEVIYERPLSPCLTAEGRVTYTESKDDATGQDIADVPRWAGQVGLYYKDRQGWRAELLGHFVGSRSALGDGGAVQRMSSFATLDARLSRQINTAWELYVLGTNLFDRGYEYWPGYPEMGRHVAIGFERRF